MKNTRNYNVIVSEARLSIFFTVVGSGGAGGDIQGRWMGCESVPESAYDYLQLAEQDGRVRSDMRR
jgi:hypothetical protein